MKIGIITDIHSNTQALKVVLEKFDKEKVDKIICCGDIVGIGIDPENAVQELIKRKDKLIAVRGNHEQYIFKGLPKEVHDDKRALKQEEIDYHNWNHSKLSNESIDFLREFPISQNIEICGKKIYIVHYPLKEDGKYKKHIKNPTLEDCKELFNNIDADIYLFGHTHTYCEHQDAEKWYINVGSLGCPLNTNLAKAGIIEIIDGKIKFESINIEYNVQQLIEEIKKIKNPFYKSILKTFYGTKI